MKKSIIVLILSQFLMVGYFLTSQETEPNQSYPAKSVQMRIVEDSIKSLDSELMN